MLPAGCIAGAHARPIVVLAGLLITQRLKGFCDFDKTFLRLHDIVRVFVGVVEHGLLAISLPDFGFAGLWVHVQHGIVVP